MSRASSVSRPSCISSTIGAAARLYRLTAGEPEAYPRLATVLNRAINWEFIAHHTTRRGQRLAPATLHVTPAE